MADPTVRHAVPEDIPAVCQLSAEFAAYLRRLGDTASALEPDDLRRDAFGDNPAFGILVAELGNEPVGYLLHHPGYDLDEGARVLYVFDLYVTEEARRQGIGRALMDEAKRLGCAVGAHQLVSAVWRRNPEAEAFYEALGAREVTELKYLYLPIDDDDSSAQGEV